MMTGRIGVARMVVLTIAVAGLAAARSLPPRDDPPAAHPIPVRYPEGTAHGFLDLRTEAGTLIGHGDLLQVPRDGAIQSRIVLRFLDGSRFEETTVFTQRDHFRLRSYRLIQRGPAFKENLDASLDGHGNYHVVTRDHDDGETDRYDGDIDDFPIDVSNGLPVVLVKNLSIGAKARVHIVAFTPKPRLIGLELAYAGADSVTAGGGAEPVAHFALSPKLGKVTGFLARLLGKMPPDSHLWVVTGEVPTFVRFQGPMYLGPVWRLDLAAPTWPRESAGPPNR